MNTGNIVDFYDDPNGIVLRAKLAHAQVPEFIRSARYQDQEKRASLSDDAFALVMVDRGEKIRKYACVDKGNTALSVIYFLENKDKLPEEAQKVAAVKLCAHCQAYGLDVPMQLRKIAETTGSSIMPKSSDPFDSPVGSPTTAKWAGCDDDEADGAAKTASAAVDAVIEKIADIAGALSHGFNPIAHITEFASHPPHLRMQWLGNKTRQAAEMISDPARAAHGQRLMGTLTKLHDHVNTPTEVLLAGAQRAAAKTASVMSPFSKTGSVYVNITGKAAPPRFEKVAHQRYCLVKAGQGKFPIDSYGDVLEANTWFSEHHRSLHPEDRREYCTKLAARADELGIRVTDQIRKYAGVGYADKGDVKIAVMSRQRFWSSGDPEHSLLDGLMDKYASVSPDIFCEALRQFDEDTGLVHRWDSCVPDPWYTTYGAEKIAAWSWVQGVDRLTEEELVRGVADGDKIYQIRQRFGDDLANAIVRNPMTIFDSLPLDSKRILSKLLSDTQ